jgi:L-fuconolactonase
LIQDIADDDWMLRADLAPAFEAMIAHDLTFDALTLPRHLGNLRELLARHPALRVVVDHGSKPDIRNGTIDRWADDMSALAQETTAFCKLSGLVTEAGADWQVETLKPYVNHLLDCFGPDRLIWGSDWPVCLLASDYARWVKTTDLLLSALSDEDQDAIRGGNANRAYELKI